MPGIADLLNSDMEDNHFMDEDSLISSVSGVSDSTPGAENTSSTKKTKKRHRVTMPKPKPRQIKTSSAPITQKVSKKATTAKSKVLGEPERNDAIAETPEQADIEVDEGMEVESKRKPAPKPVAKKTVRKRKAAVDEADNEAIEVEQTPAVAQSKFARGTATKSVPRIIQASKVQQPRRAQDLADSAIPAVMENFEQPRNDIDEISMQQPPIKRARTESRTRQDQPLFRRAGSASDTERGDPNLRRKLGDVTRKFENVDMKYKNLKEVGISEANANVEKLRRQCEAATEASNNLISSLKKELALQAPLVQDARKLKKELQAREDEITKLRSSQAELSTCLGAAQNEIKALQAKLAAARTASVSAEPPLAKTPGSAMKPTRTAVLVNGDAGQASQVAQMTLDLYGDLTGLIVRSVKRSEDGDTYECIQTGRNGTLHFKLFIDQEDAKSATFEETEFLYTPLLDTNRDRDMIELMPPYLTEDITFARQNAAKFYQRVVDTLTRRPNDV